MSHIGQSLCGEEQSSQASKLVALPPPLAFERSLLVTLAQQVEALTIAVRGLQPQQPPMGGQQPPDAPTVTVVAAHGSRRSPGRDPPIGRLLATRGFFHDTEVADPLGNDPLASDHLAVIISDTALTQP